MADEDYENQNNTPSPTNNNSNNDHSFYHYRKNSHYNFNYNTTTITNSHYMLPSSPSHFQGFGVQVVDIVKSGWLHKQGGAKGGRKSWKRRWFVLKEDCLYYYASDSETIILGVMPLVKTQLWDLAKDVQEPPARAESKVCFECKKPFTLTLRKHHC
jgi:hypothetical protein